jgi:glycosyltransferase involved in cell wall biosynthesis
MRRTVPSDLAMTRVGLNLLYLAPGDTGGMETYARALVPRLPDAWPEAEWIVFAGSELASERALADGMRLVRVPVSSHTRVRRTLAEQTLLAAAAARERVDLLHSLGTTVPLPAPGPQVVTIHDVIYKRHPDAHAGLLTRGMALLVPAAARRAQRIIVPSHAVERDLASYLHVPMDKVDVVPEGPGTEPGVAPTPIGELRKRLSLPDGPLVLAVSARRPHKNLSRLIAAMRGLDATLVLPGYPTPFDEELKAEAAGAPVVFAGWVSDEDLEGLYAAAICMVFPSLAEGFGLPVLEAMRRGVAVACSATTALGEIAGDAALTFDPRSVAAIREAIARLLGDPAERERLTQRGHDRVAGYSWSAAAAGTVASYRRALG